MAASPKPRIRCKTIQTLLDAEDELLASLQDPEANPALQNSHLQKDSSQRREIAANIVRDIDYPEQYLDSHWLFWLMDTFEWLKTLTELCKDGDLLPTEFLKVSEASERILEELACLDRGIRQAAASKAGFYREQAERQRTVYGYPPTSSYPQTTSFESKPQEAATSDLKTQNSSEWVPLGIFRASRSELTHSLPSPGMNTFSTSQLRHQSAQPDIDESGIGHPSSTSHLSHQLPSQDK